jgi:hypothetical protein
MSAETQTFREKGWKLPRFSRQPTINVLIGNRTAIELGEGGNGDIQI